MLDLAKLLNCNLKRLRLRDAKIFSSMNRCLQFVMRKRPRPR